MKSLASALAFAVILLPGGTLALVSAAPEPATRPFGNAAAGFLLNADPLFTKETKIEPLDSSVSDQFGDAVAIDGDTVVVGATSGALGGAAYVFVRNGSTWVQQQKLVTGLPDLDANLGRAVAISGDTIVVGAPQQDPGTVSLEVGSAFVFVRSGGTWSLQQELQPGDPNALAEFGNAVAIDGDTIVVGDRLKTSAGFSMAGAAYVFTRSGGVWSQQQKIVAFDAAVNDFFGTSVAIAGDTIAVGANADDDLGGESGSVYVYVFNGASWVLQQKLVAGDGTGGDFFGISAALEGDTLVVGADRAGPVDSPGPGAAYVFVRNAGVWTQQQELLAGDLDAGDGLGTSVGISGDTVVVGANLDDHGGANAGSAYVFVRSGGVWTLTQKLQASDVSGGKDFGTGVAISGDTIAVGAEAFDGPPSAGAAYIYERDTVPPVITSVKAFPSFLWPPNHKMVLVAILIAATDNFGEAPTCAVASVTSNEPVNDPGDGNTAPDWQVIGPLTVYLRAERSGGGSGRIYTVNVACQDDSGNSSSASVNVTVPH